MRSHAKVVVIGGGVVGCSVLYHLTKLGWTDVMLVERSELTSGSTWHAAGGFHTLNADTNMAALQGYTIRLYRELEEISGQSCGLHHVGGITLAATPERLDMLKAERAKHRYMGLETEIIGPEDIRKLSPITNTDGVLGGLYDPLDGHLDPSGTTHAYARAARQAGAEIVLRTPVIETNPRPDGTWDVVTKAGTIHAEHVVNAGGLWAREVAALAGVYLPLHAMEHQYLVTEDVAEVYERGSELPHVMDPEGESYLRQEGRGLCIGFYEHDCDPWAVDGTPPEFGHELLETKVDRIARSVEFAYRRYPVLERAGVKQIINGPFTFAPDGNPLVGPVPGLRNYWAAVAVMAGFSQGGGVGLTLAEWMVEGEPSRNAFAMDVARYGKWITPAYTRAKVTENYQRRFSISYPNEELPVARPFQTTPAYPIWKERRAVFGAAYGMEAVNYFAREGEPLYEMPSFRRSNAFGAVAAECRAVREAVGINEIHNFAKYRITGPGARDWLDRVFAGRIPKPGRLSLSPLLSPKGRLVGDFTISCLAEDSFQLTASFGSQAYHTRWFEKFLPADGVAFENVSTRRLGFQIAGPNARELLGRVARGDVSAAAFKFMDVKPLEVGLSRAIVQRVSYTGDLGYEIYVDAEEQVALYHLLAEAGEDLGLRPFGMRAMMSLRLEKFFGSWLREFSPDYTALETGLDRFVAYTKEADFIGKEAALAEKAAGAARKLCAFVVEARDADVVAYEPVWLDGKVQGFCTSGGYAHHVGKSVALALIPTERAVDGLEVEIEILGERHTARLVTTPLFDADGARMRG
ncbi:MAG: FAD-dependent oxidoreductase [Rhodospirillaceae bacterium]|nr:FAD-dependent oxidoreductase [Rhodospirillaceae bacterium]